MAIDLTDKVLQANIRVHTRMAASYSTEEPQFRPENKAKVRARLKDVIGPVAAANRNTKMLDLGCGTGFLIGIGAEFCAEILGVDATPAMLERVDRSGPAHISLLCGDAGRVELPPDYFDVATCYSFLHHLSDLQPVLKNAARGLKPGAKLYVDQEPNFYFWEAISGLDETGAYSPAIERELANTRHKDVDVQSRFGIDPDTFNHAEYFKNVRGGFREEDLRQQVLAAGFSHVEFFYYWFLGEALLLNEPDTDRNEQLEKCATTTRALRQSLPLSRNLFKYLGFVATKEKQ